MVLGATSQLGVYNCNPDDADRHFILTETAKFVPSLQVCNFAAEIKYLNIPEMNEN